MRRSAPARWGTYWDGVRPRRIFAVEAADHVDRLLAVVPVRPTDVVLDFGCGFGHGAALMARRVGRVDYWDLSASMRAATRERTATLPGVGELDLSAGAPAAARGRYDLVLVTSVVQYLDAAELTRALDTWAALLRPSGMVVLSDVPGPGRAIVREALGMLRFAARHGFLRRALLDAAADLRTYARSRSAARIDRRTVGQVATQAARSGLSLERLPVNLTHRSTRWSALLHPVGRAPTPTDPDRAAAGTPRERGRPGATPPPSPRPPTSESS